MGFFSRKCDDLLAENAEGHKLQKFGERHNGFDRLRERGEHDKNRAFQEWLDQTEREHNARKGRR